MKYRAFLAFAMIVPFASKADAEFVVSLDAEANGSYSTWGDTSHYLFFPNISVWEDSYETDKLVTFTSPTGDFEGYVNDPESVISSSSHMTTTEELVAAVTGTWLMTIEDQQNAISYEYEVDIALQLPFVELPMIHSSSLVNGGQVGLLDWALVGGSAEFPGPSAELRARLFVEGGGLVDEALLPLDATSWLPNGELNSPAGYRASVYTSNEPRDFVALSILAIRPFNEDLPELIFSDTAVTYTASRTASLVAVPEPSTWMLATLSGIGLLGLGMRRQGLVR